MENNQEVHENNQVVQKNNPIGLENIIKVHVKSNVPKSDIDFGPEWVSIDFFEYFFYFSTQIDSLSFIDGFFMK